MTRIKSFFSAHKRGLILSVLIAFAIWTPRATGLDSFVYIDETPWIQRSANFYYALEQREFDRTFQNISPGVVTMWIETAAFITEFRGYRVLAPGYYGSFESGGEGLVVRYENKYNHLEKFILENGVDPLDIIVTSRAYTVILISIVLAGAFFFAQRLFGALPAIVGFLLLSFDTFYLANTRFAHLDGPMSAFILLSFLAFADYLYKSGSIKTLLISGIAGGLAMLSKQPGILIVPTIGILILLKIFEHNRADNIKLRHKISSGIKTYTIPILIWAGVLLITFFVVWPAMWVEPVEVILKVFLYPIRFLQDPNTGQRISAAAEQFAESDLEETRNWLRYPASLIWLTTPLVLTGALAAIIAYIKRFALFSEEMVRKGFLALVIFVLVFTAIISFPLKSSARYYIPVHASVDLIAGLGWMALASWAASKLSKIAVQKYVLNGILVLVIAIQSFTALSRYPYYLPYNNPLLGGNSAANETRYISFGEGLDQAAAYLNNKPDAKKLNVISWYAFGPFSSYFVGQSFDSQLLANQPEALRLMDYMVSYRNSWYRDYLAPYQNALDQYEPEYVIWIDGIEYVRIYNVRTLPEDIFDFD